MKCDYAVCNSVRAVFVGVLFTLQLEVLLQATETCPNSEKITNRQDLEHAENSNCSSSCVMCSGNSESSALSFHLYHSHFHSTVGHVIGLK